MDKYKNLNRTFEREMEVRFSNWFPKIENCGIKVPKSFVFPVPGDVVRACYMERPDDMARINAYIEHDVMPTLKANRFDQRLLFVKNATFSNKFYADGSCLTDANQLANAIIRVNQGAMELIIGYDGTDELVIRERIPYNCNQTACIYHGLPFRAEYRVFYDFDDKSVIFVQDYWDKDYVRPHLYDLTDQLVFDGAYPAIRAEFETHKDEVAEMVKTAMAGVTGLSGPWSIDIMFGHGDYYLIDMAVAENSSYWDKRPGYETPVRESKPRPVMHSVTEDAQQTVCLDEPVKSKVVAFIEANAKPET